MCHTPFQKSLMRSWEEVGVVWKEVRWREGKRNIIAKNIYAKYIFAKNIFAKNIFNKIFSPKIFSKTKFSPKNIFAKNILAKNIVEKNIFKKNPQKIFSKKNTYAKYFSKKKRCCPQGLGWYRAIARSQPSFSIFLLVIECEILFMGNIAFILSCLSHDKCPSKNFLSLLRLRAKYN